MVEFSNKHARREILHDARAIAMAGLGMVAKIGGRRAKNSSSARFWRSSRASAVA
jgi:hypothetical protein